MVKVFSRLGNSNRGNSQKQSSIETREASASASASAEVIAGNPPAGVANGIGKAVEFRPIEHPSEPPQHDQPVKFPQPEPSILYNGRRQWKLK